MSLDIGSRQGIGKDMTVVNKDGLVGRVIAVSDSSSTVLLIVDTNSVVGGRLGSNNEIGFLRGRGSFNDSGRLDLDMLDDSVTPSIDDLVVTWGSNGKGPYV
ncbi:MAG: rod shape-determining protein MreC, partial [Nocardioidaceae bacterium]|nr:rod shape-determining protein MreC [Nocardioidaceae bacterium]